jgi:hypothetical protein
MLFRQHYDVAQFFLTNSTRLLLPTGPDFDWLAPREFSPLARTVDRFKLLFYLRFIIQPINVPAVKPTANVVATVSTGCRWMR